MKTIHSLSILLIALALTACASPSSPQNTDTAPASVTSFEECVAAGNLVMESDPRQCRHGEQVFTEEIGGAMPPGQQPCTREYVPVCGEVQIECVTEPCEPIRITFPNRCGAENAGASNIAEGACVDEEINPEGACLSFDGTWLPETMECEGMAQEQCEVLGGTYNECASACRNDPDAQVCTMQCVQVCQF